MLSPIGRNAPNLTTPRTLYIWRRSVRTQSSCVTMLVQRDRALVLRGDVGRTGSVGATAVVIRGGLEILRGGGVVDAAFAVAALFPAEEDEDEDGDEDDVDGVGDDVAWGGGE